ncbi:uncharacterized protein LOC108107516 [Drosophila eugracilis]|uniref:uncharacterized protein LOC108107516 n=1 Tax=Drosophila eugracilis TaxID=29029 RepID=UPI0007E7E056|nr:uncharacterized protein LOC108107516 [Drosophila eugracilis]
MRNHHWRPGKPVARIQDPGHPPVTCLSALANAMQVAPTGPSGCPGSRAFSCSASKAMRDKYLLTAITAGISLEALMSWLRELIKN